MKTNFDRSLELTLAWEGGAVHHPKDPGGRTNRGVTQRTYDRYRRDRNRPRKDVFQIAPAEVADIYRSMYWNLVKGDQLPAGADYAVFDYAVNSGPGRAARALQKIVGARVDGIIGPETVDLTREAYARDPVALVEAICEERYRFVRSLKTWKTFGRGWKRRIMGETMGAQSGDIGVIDYASDMAERAAAKVRSPELPLPKKPTMGKADPEDVAISRTPEGVGAGTTVVGGIGAAAATAAEKIQDLTGISDIALYAFVGLTVVAAISTVGVMMVRARRGEAAA
ncbi:glycoside hydrolase family 108 protein [Kaustia mangrovi]|uniref:Glycoside hydrolase family 108 protein n=1 Tax=Kaustia mangrovi TaxID=2593653 RepID=A0A7S8C5Z4_9HYPH|nr:glycosyl hydrolase 108 family protein [Kaustia mangrovi]QPC44021.1 glycoside hydrolase family 108 protein [Kaustia mangrovi]